MKPYPSSHIVSAIQSQASRSFVHKTIAEQYAARKHDERLIWLTNRFLVADSDVHKTKEGPKRQLLEEARLGVLWQIMTILFDDRLIDPSDADVLFSILDYLPILLEIKR